MARVAITTGATRGIGWGIFARLAMTGCAVATIYHQDDQAADRFRRYAEQSGAQHLIEKADVEDLTALPGFVRDVQSRFGRVDYLINNVGADDFNSVFDLTFEEWKRSQDVILNAPFVLCKAVLPIMRQQRFGRIVNIGASSYDFSKGVRNSAAFGVHKGALSILTKTLALEEITNGITVNMVAPGSTAGAGTLLEEERIPVTEIPIGRRVSVDEVVDAVMYFLSDGSSAVTGQCIGVNGGRTT